jgi:hypothetical protein
MDLEALKREGLVVGEAPGKPGESFARVPVGPDNVEAGYGYDVKRRAKARAQREALKSL